ncbi:MAG: glycoside hydrolase [Planctomycetota bacterium]|nr:MAG: glycoside hydrolase [Planctomycetota bacterium]
MKILQVATYTYPDHPGGAERVIAEVCRGLAERGHHVELVTGKLARTSPANTGHAADTPGAGDRAPSHATPLTSTEQHGRLTIHRYALQPGAIWRSARAGVHAALRAGVGASAQVLHVHQIASALPALRAARALEKQRGARLPRLLSFYAPYHLEHLARHRDGREAGRVSWRARASGFALRQADRRVLRAADGVLALSEYSRRQIAALSSSALARTSLSTGGVDLENFRPALDDAERAAARAHFGLPASGPLILSVRRQVPRMGLADLLDALARLHALGCPAQLALAGDGPERAPLEARSRELGLERAVNFLGRVADEDLPCLYRAANLFALPTRGLEGFGLVSAEALASGLPVVATQVGATPEVLADLDCATLVPPENPSALADALASWLQDPEACTRASERARQHALERLGWEHHVDHVEAACRALSEARA